MVRVIRYIFFILMIFGCEMNSKQIIKTENFAYEIVKFNTVSKELINNYTNQNSDQIIMSQIIDYWFKNRIKTDGFNGKLEVIIDKIDIIRVKEINYYKFSIEISMSFVEFKSQNIKNQYTVNANEFGEINGDFSINDQENLDINLMHKSIESITRKLKEIN